MPEIEPIVSIGISNHCPFCKGRILNCPVPGSRIQLLSGYNCGASGTVSIRERWQGGEEFSVHFDHDPPGVLCRVLVRHTQYLLQPVGAPPSWLPYLSTDDLAYIDEDIVRLCANLFQQGKWCWRDEELYALVEKSWRSRLPVYGKQIWAMCAAHGMPQDYKSRFIKAFDFGLGLLVYSHGRPPIKRRSVPPMSIERYEPKRRNLSKYDTKSLS